MLKSIILLLIKRNQNVFKSKIGFIHTCVNLLNVGFKRINFKDAGLLDFVNNFVLWLNDDSVLVLIFIPQKILFYPFGANYLQVGYRCLNSSKRAKLVNNFAAHCEWHNYQPMCSERAKEFCNKLDFFSCYYFPLHFICCLVPFRKLKRLVSNWTNSLYSI